MHASSFFFSEPSTAYVRMIVLNLFVGITTVLTNFMISIFEANPTLVTLNKRLQWLFFIFPNYNLGKGLMDLSYYEYVNQFYSMVSCCRSSFEIAQYLDNSFCFLFFVKTNQPELVRSPFEWDIITRGLVSMTFLGFLGFALTLYLEFRNFVGSEKEVEKALRTQCQNQVEDVDVEEERERVDELWKLNEEEDLIVVKNIRKVFRRNKVVLLLSFYFYL